MQTPSAIADLLLAAGGHAGRRHMSFELPNGAMLVVPKQGTGRRAGLALYNPQRATGLAAKGLLWTGLWPGRTVEVLAGPLDELRNTLAVALGEPHVECAFQFGSTGIYSKTVILVMDRAGRPLAYAKTRRAGDGAGGPPARGLCAQTVIDRHRVAWSGSACARADGMARLSSPADLARFVTTRAKAVRRDAS